MHELEAHLTAHPDDLAAWLVYGDWLLEQGDRRGELVRSRRELTKDERRLYRGPLPEKVALGWRNGFVVEVDVPLDPRAVPVLAQFVAHDTSRLLSSLVARTFSCEDDYFEPPQTDREGDTLAQILALDLCRLGALSIRYLALTDDHIEALVRTNLAIHTLDLRYTALTDARLARLAQAPWFAGVRRLHLQRNPLTQLSAPLLASPEADVPVPVIRLADDMTVDGEPWFDATPCTGPHDVRDVDDVRKGL